MRNRIVILGAIVVLCAFGAIAQTPPKVGGELLVGQYGQGDGRVAADMDGAGGFVVAWYKGGYPGGVKARRFSPTAVGGNEISVSTYSASSAFVDAAQADSGNFVVVWNGYEPYSGYGTQAKVFNSAGSPIVGPLNVGYTTADRAAVSMNKSSGDFVVAWIEGSYGYYYGAVQKYNSGGAPVGSTYSFGNSPADVDVAMDRAGNFVVTWVEDYSYMGYAAKSKAKAERVAPTRTREVPQSGAAPSFTVQASGYGPYGRSFGSSGPISSNFTIGTLGYGNDPSISAVGSGNFVVAWGEDAGGSCYPDVKARVFNTAGTMLTAPFDVDQQSTFQQRPAVAGNGSSFVVTWESSLGCPLKVVPSPEQDGSGTAVVGRLFTAGGSPLSNEFIVNTTTSGYQYGSTTGMNSSGAFVVGWTNSNTYPNLVNAQLFAQTQTPPPPPTCGSGFATGLSPSSGTVENPVTFSWTGVGSGLFYEVWASVDGGPFNLVGLTASTTLTKSVGPGAIAWYVRTQFGTGCNFSNSSTAQFTVTSPPPPPPPPPPTCEITIAPLPSVVAESTTGEFYELTWTAVSGASTYQVQESLLESFVGATTFSVQGTSLDFKHPGIETPIAYYYRVRPVADCNTNVFGPYSKVIRVVNLPKPEPSSTNPQIVTEFGNEDLVSTQLFIPGFGSSSKTTPFAASYTVESNEPWLTPSPAQGELPPGGTTVDLTANPTMLDLGANIATITVTRNDGLGKTTHGASTSKLPVSVSLVSPITPLGKETSPPANALIIPAVANVGGVDSKWLSDVRINNTANTTVQYQLTFTATEKDGTIEGKKTGYTLRPGQTVAMDDIVRQWFGFGDLADGTNGTLEIRPLNFQGVSTDPEATLAATVATSRTYTRDANSLASFGQFMPSVPFASFINSSLAGARLSMQQISQDQSSRTNIGIVEGAGKAVNVQLTVFDRLGTQLGQFPISLLAGEHRQLNSLLAQNNISVVDGRIEATVTGGDGAITAYASVVSSGTGDPTLVRGVDPSSINASKYVLGGIADLVNGDANWRSDVRFFNGGATAQSADLFFYPQGSTTPVGPFSITVAAGEVKLLEGVVRTQFGLENTGGAMHVVTPNSSSLVITGETFDVNDDGKYGQTIPSVTLDEAVGTSDRALQILQLEDSAQYRTNLGLAEMTGKPVTVQVQLIIPLSLSAPMTTVQLGANEFRQLNGVVRTLAGRDVYNARLAVRVTGGEGKILAYGSVVDNKTLDATYVPGQ
ncbi:MAG: hypothetical protein ACSLFQ_17765 [Thermoanaerobaculia bacterium]